MAEENKKQQAVFTKVEQLRPMATGVNLIVKVINSKVIAPRGPQGRQFRVAECLVGDETGMIIFAAKNDQVNLVKDGATINLRNAKVDMYRGSMRLAVDKWGRIEVTEDASFSVNEDSRPHLRKEMCWVLPNCLMNTKEILSKQREHAATKPKMTGNLSSLTRASKKTP